MERPRDLEAAARKFLPFFAIKAFDVVNPGVSFAANVGFLAIAQALSEVAEGRTRRLLVTVPPRSGKSLLASIALPAFILGRNPTKRIICASYSGELAAKLARDCRTVMGHPSYRQLFPGTRFSGKNTETEIETAAGGFRYATSVGGTLTGRGGGFIIIDDPIKPDDAMSQTARQRAWDWFTQTVGSRLDNKADDAIVVVMQRLHVDDLAGRLLDCGGWTHLCIPAIAEDAQTLAIAPDRTFERPVGHVLDEVREPRLVLEELRRELGTTTFEAQYQQQPVPEQGGLINWTWFKTYDQAPSREPSEWVVASWDTAMKDHEVNDYSVGIVALVKPNGRIVILDVIRERLNFPALRTRILEEAQKRVGTVTLIEDAGSGTALLQDLQRCMPVVPRRPFGDKVMRFNAVTPTIEGGQVHLPARAPWLDAFKRELLSFPASANDDQVDALSQLLNWVKERTTYRHLQTTYGAFA